MPDVIYASEVQVGVVSSHFRCCLPFADICFDTQPLLLPDILLKMLEPGILFRTLNLNQSHSDLSWDRKGPDLRQHVPFSGNARLTACCTSQSEQVTFDIYLTPWCGIFHPDPDSVAQSLTLVSDASNRPMSMGSLLAFSLLI